MVYHFVTIRRATIEKLERCKLIVRCGAGFDNIDYLFAKERGIPVANVPDYGTEDVADTAIGLVLALARGTHLYNHNASAGQIPGSIRSPHRFAESEAEFSA